MDDDELKKVVRAVLKWAIEKSPQTALADICANAGRITEIDFTGYGFYCVFEAYQQSKSEDSHYNVYAMNENRDEVLDFIYHCRGRDLIYLEGYSMVKESWPTRFFDGFELTENPEFPASSNF